MRHKRFWLAVVSALMTTQNNTGEAAEAVPNTGRDHSVRLQASAPEEEAVVTLFDEASYTEVLETAGVLWPRQEAMPDKVLYCVAESHIRVGQVQLAKTGFELLVARDPQNHSFRAGLAYTLLYAGEMEKGLAMYHQVLLENQRILTVAAEDAVALISQGNINGGKALFQMVIASSPTKHQYLQWYQNSLRMYGLADDSKMSRDTGPVAVVQPAPAKSNKNLLHTQAVEMAKNGQYQQSLDIMARLLDEHSQDKTIIFDSLAILQWAGQNGKAVSLYEQQAKIDMPFYVIRSVSTAYFRLRKYDEALAVLQQAITRGERDALLWAGEMYLLRGDIAGAHPYYDRLLAKNPNDYEVYVSRGTLSLQIEDYRQAIRDLERARRLVPDSSDKAIRLGKVEHKLAIAYIHLGQAEKAASILVNYTRTLPADGLIAGDYILALSNSAQYKLAVQEGERLWPAYTEAPVHGLKSLAESYIRLGKQEQAIAVYRHLAERHSGDDTSWQTLAFQLMLNGRITEGLSYYDQLLTKATPNVDSVVADAVTLLNTEKYIAGKMLFELVLNKYSDQAYRKQYAEILSKKNLNRAAYQQYQLLSVQPEGELAGLSGMVRTALALDDYQKSRQALDMITGKYGRSKAVAALEASYAERQPGSLETSYAVTNRYQGTEPGSPSMLNPQEKKSQFLTKPEKTGELDTYSAAVSKGTIDKSKDEIAYEIALIAEKLLAAPTTNDEIFKADSAYAISKITAKVMPIIPNDQRNEFTYEMAQLTSKIINDQNLDIKKAKAEFAQLTTKVAANTDKSTSDTKLTFDRNNDNIDSKAINGAITIVSDQKAVNSINNTASDQKTVEHPGYIAPETYKGLIDELMQVGTGSKHLDNKLNIDGEIRYHYAFNSGAEQWGRDSSGIRAYLGADTGLNNDWHVYSMLEGQKSVVNYNNFFKLSRLYVEGKVGTSTVSAGKFGYLMAEGNIYDSGFTGVRVNFGDLVKYTLSYGETNDTKATYTATARYNDFDYNLEAGIYRYQSNGSINDQNTIWNIGGNYKFSNFSVGAMYLGSNLEDSKGNSNGYVLSFNYGDLHTYRPGTYGIFAKYYNQSRGTYIAHGMNGRGASMQGLKGYGLGMYYTLAKDLVGGIEYYDLKDKVAGDKGKTMWLQVTHYF